MGQLARSEALRRHKTVVGLARAWSKEVDDMHTTEDKLYNDI